MNTRSERWASGEGYEPYVGRWSRRVAAEFVGWLDRPAGIRWLDVGSGTGALTETILALGEPAEVVGVDRSLEYVAYARGRVADPRATFLVGDAQELPVSDASFDVAVSGLLLNFLPDSGRGVAEMARAVRPGTIVAAYVWDYGGEMQMMRRFWDAAGDLDPAARELDEGRRFPLCRPGPLLELFEGAGLQAVAVRPIEVATEFTTFDDYWAPFLDGQGPAPGYAVSLTEERRATLRDELRRRLPIDDDGSIRLVARAWAVRGERA